MRSHRRERGFTLIEMIVALALFALISVAGLALVDAVLAARRHLDGRLDRLADLDRAATLIDADLSQVTGGAIDAGPRGIGFDRTAGHGTIGRVHVSYLLDRGMLERIVDGRAQALLDGVASIAWSFHVAGSGWRSSWPPSPAQADAWPEAIAIDIGMRPGPDRPTGMLRRVVLLPVHP